ncbi:MAG: C4-dicarboxylate ABC transporter [Acidobacteria bacterium]|nr:C4-dicarboxylate ABC transporter [Acidobacteriota bacterium]
MSVHVIGIIVLLVVFVVGTLRPVNLGALALVGTFAVGGLVAGEDLRKMLSGFPADLFVLLFGVTYLFGIASVNGTVEWLVNSLARLVGDKAAFIPWVIFFVAAIPTTVGALGPAGVAMLSPIALRLTAKYGINSRLSALMLIHGSGVGNFSPLNPLGAIVNGTMERSGLPTAPMTLFAANLAYNVALGVAIYLVFGGFSLLRARRSGAPEPKGRESATSSAASPTGAALIPATKISLVHVFTLIAVTAVAVGAIGFKLDVGLLAVIAAVALHLLFPTSSKGASSKVSWGVVLLICGVVTYMALLQRMGTITMAGNSVAKIGAPLLAGFLICAVAAVSSAFSSTAGVLGAMIPLAVPLLSTGQLWTAGVAIALAISATVVDATPFSTVGAVVVANCKEDETDWVFRGLFLWGMVMVLTAPVATWLFFILPG